MKKVINFTVTTGASLTSVNSITSNYFMQQASLYNQFDLGELKEKGKPEIQWNEEDETLIKKYSVYWKKDDKYSIKDYERNLVLRTLQSSGIREMLDEAPLPYTDELTQTMFNSYVNGKAPPLSKQNDRELAVSYTVSKWLKGTGIEVPAEEDILLFIKQGEMFQPFKILTTNFEGRKKELALLSDYVDWRPKSTVLGSVQGFFRDIIRWHEKPPLIITGIGGVGKSTLVSKFILNQISYQHNTLPFVYFDFDKPGLSVSNPIELAIEALRQLSILFPSSQNIFSEMRDQLKEEFLEREQKSTIEFVTQSRGSDRQVIYEKYAMRYQKQIERINRPVLVVFDSFEEIQYRVSSSELDNLFNFIREISNIIPRLRPVFIGRSEVSYAGTNFEKLNLTAFDHASASAFLLSKGVTDERLRETVYKKLGGHPLTLQLAANLIKQEGIHSADAIEKIAGKLDQSLILELLIKRTVEHVHGPLVAKIAVPGILVRRINAEIIQKVLAVPCGLPDLSDTEAEEIFTELRKETFLIVENGNNINFRPDLRMSLYDLIMKRPEYNGMAIHNNAVEFYKDKEGPEYKAEYLYHRLMRGDNPSSIRNIYNDEVRSYIENSLVELPNDAYLYLSSLMGIKASSEKVEQSGLLQWEEYQKSQIVDLLKKGDEQSLNRISEEILERTERSLNSPLYYYEAKVFMRLANFRKAESVINRAIAEANPENNKQQLSLLLLKTELYEYQLDFSSAFSTISSAPLLKLATEYLLHQDFSEVEDIIGSRLAWSRLAKRMGDNQFQWVIKTLYNFIQPLQDTIYGVLLEIAKTVNLSALLPFPYKTYVETIYKKEASAINFRSLFEQMDSSFSKQDIFLTKLQSLQKEIRNKKDLEKFLEKNYGLNLKDICEPGVLKINLIDVMKFMELSDPGSRMADNSPTNSSA